MPERKLRFFVKVTKQGVRVKTKLLPYRLIDGIPTFRDSEIVQVYNWTKEDDLLQKVYYNIDTSKISEDWFLQFWKRPDISVYVVLLNGKVGGWVWIDQIIDNSANIHLCIFKWTWGVSSIKMCRDGLLQLLNIKNKRTDRYMVDILVGYTPVYNQLAVRFSKKVGFKKAGIIPKSLFYHSIQVKVDAYVSYISRDII